MGYAKPVLDNLKINLKPAFPGQMACMDPRALYDMEEIDVTNLGIPEEVAPYAKQIFSDLRNDEKKVRPAKHSLFEGRLSCSPRLHGQADGHQREDAIDPG